MATPTIAEEEEGLSSSGPASPKEAGPAEHDESEEMMLAVVEALAEATAERLLVGQVDSAVAMLRHAVLAYEDDVANGAEPPPSALMACAAMRLLLCSSLSRGGWHDLALEEACSAATAVGELWRCTLCPNRDDSEDRAAVSASEALAVVLRAPRPLPPHLVKGVELAVQVRQCAGLELELMNATCAARDRARRRRRRLGVLDSDDEEEAEEEGEGSPPVDVEVKRLYEEAAQLACRLLTPGHPVRLRAEQSFEAIQGAPEGSTSRRLARADLRCLAGLLTGQPAGPLPEGSMQVPERRWKPLAPLVVAGWGPEPSNFEKMHRGFGLHAPGSGGGNGRGRPWSLDDTRGSVMSSSGGAQTTVTSGGWGRTTVGNEQAEAKKPRGHPRWHATVRLMRPSSSQPSIGTAASTATSRQGRSMWGTGTGWSIIAGRGATNQFDDWRRNANGPVKSLGMKVLESEGAMRLKVNDLKEKNARFKNFWLRQEVSADELFEDRVRFSTEGMKAAVYGSRKYPRAGQARVLSPSTSGSVGSLSRKDKATLSAPKLELRSLQGQLVQSQKWATEFGVKKRGSQARMRTSVLSAFV